MRSPKKPKLKKPVLYYVHDPMCSWCWAFKPTWERLRKLLGDDVEVELLLGGLAIDDPNPMPAAQREAMRKVWETIEATVPGTTFNYDFWTKCKPKRSTYPACRAVISARLQIPGHDAVMIDAIQKAYYLDARNPSDDDVLETLAYEIGLDVPQFDEDINRATTHLALEREIFASRRMGVQGFPSLVLKQNEGSSMVPIDYRDAGNMESAIRGAFEPDFRPEAAE